MEKEGLGINKRLAIPDDLIRAVAMILVILLHASNDALQASNVPIGDWWIATIYKSLSLSCVPLFVMLSGLLLLQPAKVNEPIHVFLRKRLARLGLAFAFWSGVYLAWSFYISATPVTLSNVYRGIMYSLFQGAYYQFWFIYLIVGLYLITPVLRVVIAYGEQKVTRYLIILWFLAVAILPLIQLALGYTLNPDVFIFGGFVGYFVLGFYVQKVSVRGSILFSIFVASVFLTIFGTWLLSYPLSSMGQAPYFLGYLTVNVIAGSVAIFLILLKFKPDWPGTNNKFSQFSTRIIQAISKNTLPIFLFHVIILETFERGLLGFTLDYATLNPIVEIPLITALTLFITLGLVLLMKKVPVLRTLIG